MKREIIVIENKYKLVETGLDWQIYEFKSGGDINRNPRTGEEVISVDRWVPLQAFFSKESHLRLALAHIVKMETTNSLEDSQHIRDVIERYDSISQNLMDKIDKGLLSI